MSVLTRERHPEEFPELAKACADAFQKSIEAKPSSLVPPRTTPLCITVTDFDQPTVSAATEFAAVTMEAIVTSSPKATQIASAPNDAYFTMEDGGQSDGACATSAKAAFILAHLNDAPETTTTPTPRRVPNFRPCDAGPACCC